MIMDLEKLPVQLGDPTQAKVRLEWGTQPLLLVEREILGWRQMSQIGSSLRMIRSEL
jgi:hypothetical protein